MGEIRCCVCQKLIRYDTRLKDGEISHTYCPKHYKEAMQAVDKMIAEHSKKKVKR